MNEIITASQDILGLLRSLRSDRRGVTALEYGLIASLIAVVIISAVTTLGTKLTTVFGSVSSKL